MKKLILSIPGYLLLFACTNNIKPVVSSDNHEFFPVKSFLKGQMNQVDSLKLPTHKYSSINGKADSILISLGEFDSLANEFVEPDINDPAIKKFYKETSFADQSIPNVTFTYSTGNRDLPLQRIDVIVNPDPVVNDQVKSVYLEKITASGDTAIVKKFYWKTNKYFQILSSKQIIGRPPNFSTVKVSWSPTD